MICIIIKIITIIPDSKIDSYVGLSAPDGPHVGPMNFVIWDDTDGEDGKDINNNINPVQHIRYIR